MKASFFPLVLCSLLTVASCNETESPANTTATNTTAPSAVNCYAEQHGKDISVIQLQQDKDNVQGYYTYEPYEKDRGYGTLTGKVNGDQINAELAYIMEGGINKEKSIFKRIDGNLAQATGEIKEDDTTMFDDPTKLNIFKPVDCSKVKTSIDYAIEAAAEIKKESESCMDKALSTVDMQACNEKAYREWDEKLNTAYGALQEDLGSEKAKAALKTSQQHWLKFRDTELTFIDKMYQAQQGTYWGTVAGGMKGELLPPEGASFQKINS